jgi:aminopeptidase-like protein
VRETLAVLGREVDLETIETPSGTKVFDWTVPREWTIRGGWIEGPDGTRVVDFAESPLHVLGYSARVDATVGLDELRHHVFTHPEDPDLVPYRTSYWEEQWDFYMTARTLNSLSAGEYQVLIDATLADGSLTSGELRIRGSSEKEFLLSTHICHPALANDNLSGRVLLWALAKTLSRQELRYSYRLLWSPDTLGPLCWLDRNLATLDRVEHGLAISYVGDHGRLRYKRSRQSHASTDRAGALAVGRDHEGIVSDWEPLGGDERQFCAPGFDLPVGALTRTPHGDFDVYHSSGDDLEFVSAASLAGSYRAELEIVDQLETNAVYKHRAPFGEPQLGRRGLYQAVPDGTFPESALLWVLKPFGRSL